MSDLLPHAALVAPAVLVTVGLALFGNRRIRGFLPEDVPRAGRKQHDRRTVMAGGLLVPWLAGLAMTDGRIPLALVVLGAGLLGFVDDWGKERGRDLAWRPKAVVLGGAALAIASMRFDPLAEPVAFGAAVATAFVLTNAINFLDNMDGVAGAVAAACLFLHGGIEGLFAAGAFAALGFLPWNWPRPRAFLGDAGAYALGTLCAAACVERLPDPRACVPFAVPLFDFVQVVLVRVALRLPPWRGDRRHVSHVLHNAGVARWLVAPLLALLAVAVALVARAD